MTFDIWHLTDADDVCQANVIETECEGKFLEDSTSCDDCKLTTGSCCSRGLCFDVTEGFCKEFKDDATFTADVPCSQNDKCTGGKHQLETCFSTQFI